MRKSMRWLACVFLLLLPQYAEAAALKIIFMNVGQGDAALLICNHEAMMINTGPAGAWSHIEAVLAQEEIDTLKYLVATHPHQDHIGNVDEILETYEVKTVLLPPIEAATKAYNRMLAAIEVSEVETVYPEVGDCFGLGGARITVYAPYPVAYSEPNDWSIVLMMVESHGRSALFCADAEAESEMDMIAGKDKYPLDADILKVGHHGSDTSSTYDFIEAVSPQIAIVSCGKSERYPSTDVAMTLVELGAEIYTTHKEGDITVTLNDNGEMTLSSGKITQ